MADPNVDAARNADLAKLPIFSGIKNTDTFTCEQWIERINRARAASNWTEAQTMSFVFNALRGPALAWFDTLRRSGVDRDNWVAFRQAFLAAYSTSRTPRTTIVHLADLQQGQAESVVNFYTRVVKAVDELEALVPGGAVPLPATVFPPTFTAVPAFVALPAADKTAAAAALVAHGATFAFNHMALNLFISNLRPFLRDELLKAPPATLYEAFQQATALEKIHLDPKKPDVMPIMPVDAPAAAAAAPSSIADGLDAEIEALNARIKHLQSKRPTSQQYRPQNNNNNRNNNNNNGRPQQQQQQPQRQRRAARPDDQCRYCLKLGHHQHECFSRRRDNAPKVGADGKPYRTAAVDQVVSQQQQQPPQQQQQYQFANNMQMLPNSANFNFPYLPTGYTQDFQ